ncbi:MAG: flagellar hook-basal body complex protein FliE [Methylibium sp.]|nr:flagellar hook-basal body complex protein FliE [Methylibium sp.]
MAIAAAIPGLNPVQLELARIEQDALRLGAIAPAQGEADASGAGFAQSMTQALLRVDAKGQDAGERMAAVERGESDDLVGAMLASQDASLSFSMLMQVRNKVVGAVDELIKLQL